MLLGIKEHMRFVGRRVQSETAVGQLNRGN